MKIAVAHPGKLGDALYALPTVRYLSGLHGMKADFWTSDWCKPLAGLLEAQSCIDKVIVPDDYKMQDAHCGVRPWRVPVHGEYVATYQLGFRDWPDASLPDYIAKQVGLVKAPELWLETAPKQLAITPRPVLCSKALATYPDWFEAFMALRPQQEFFAVSLPKLERKWPNVIDATGPDLLSAARVVEKAPFVVGMPSIIQTIATFFPVKSAACVGKRHWDDVHLVKRYGLDLYYTTETEPSLVWQWLEQ